MLELIGAGARDEGFEPAPHGFGRVDDRTGQCVLEHDVR
jgi:hypothetical protein